MKIGRTGPVDISYADNEHVRTESCQVSEISALRQSVRDFVPMTPKIGRSVNLTLLAGRCGIEYRTLYSHTTRIHSVRAIQLLPLSKAVAEKGQKYENSNDPVHFHRITV